LKKHLSRICAKQRFYGLLSAKDFMTLGTNDFLNIKSLKTSGQQGLTYLFHPPLNT